MIALPPRSTKASEFRCECPRSSSEIFRAHDHDRPRDKAQRASDAFVLRGGSASSAPMAITSSNLFTNRKRLSPQNSNLNAVDREKMTLDVSGHYSRPDIFTFQVCKREHEG